MSLLARFKRDAVATAVIASLAIGAFGFVAVTPKDGGYTQLDLAAQKCKKKGNKKQKKKCKKKKGNPSPRPTGTTAPSGTPSPTTSGAPSPAPTGSPGAGGGGAGATSCATPYTPGEQGAEAETSIVTPEHTEEAPLEIPITVNAGIPVAGAEAGIADTFHNVQVDSPGAVGLYVRLEFEVVEDMDLYLNYADGSEAASVGGFNPTPVGLLDGTGSGGHSEMGAEQLDGVRTPSCAGYTIDVHPFMNEPGEKTLLLWQGEPTFDPPPPGAGAAVMR